MEDFPLVLALISCMAQNMQWMKTLFLRKIEFCFYKTLLMLFNLIDWFSLYYIRINFRTINYRLSIFGFCNGVKGIPHNLGLHDQRLAIQWIKDNINYFGGDLNNITLMGESAGAASVHCHSLSDHDHLFQKMILQAHIITANRGPEIFCFLNP